MGTNKKKVIIIYSGMPSHIDACRTKKRVTTIKILIIMDETKKENLKVVLQVNANNFNSKGEIIDAISGGAKLTKADAGRISQNDEDTITITGTDCGNATITADYRSVSNGIGEKETEVELDLKGSILNPEKTKLVDGFVAQSKLKTVFGGKNAKEVTEDWHRLKADKDCKSGAGCASVESYYTTKTSEIAE